MVVNYCRLGAANCYRPQGTRLQRTMIAGVSSTSAQVVHLPFTRARRTDVMRTDRNASLAGVVGVVLACLISSHQRTEADLRERVGTADSEAIPAHIQRRA